MSEILKSIKARLNRLKKIEEEHKKNTDDINQQKLKDTQEKYPSQHNELENIPDKGLAISCDINIICENKLKLTTDEIDHGRNEIDSTRIVAPEVEEVVTENSEQYLDLICESLSQSKIESNEIEPDVKTTLQAQSKQPKKMDLTISNVSLPSANDSRLAEEDSFAETSHVSAKENDDHFDGEWLSVSINQVGIEPVSDLFSQSFELSDHDASASVPDICDRKLSSSTKSVKFGIELPGETVTSNEIRTVDLPQSTTPKFQNYLVLNSQQDVADMTVTSTNASFILPSMSDFNLPPEQPKPFCHCREPTADRISKKENENKDRTYYVCATNKCRFFRWGAKAREGEIIVEALKNAKVVKRIAKNPITNYFPKKKKIDKIISPMKTIETDYCDQIMNQPSKNDEIDLESEMDPYEILNLQPNSQENTTQNNTTDTLVKASRRTENKNPYTKMTNPFGRVVQPDLNGNLDMNTQSSSTLQVDEVMDTDSIKSDVPKQINPLDESIMTAGPDINRTQKVKKNEIRTNNQFHDLLNTSTDVSSGIKSFSDDKVESIPSKNLDNLDLSFSSEPLFSQSLTLENSLEDVTDHMTDFNNPFIQANIRMRNNLNRAIADSSSAYNSLQTILKSQTDPAFLSKTANFPSKYNTPFSM